jgi:hypothetical protein
VRFKVPRFKPLKPGCIHLRCSVCGRKVCNVKREEWDHPDALWSEFPCDLHCEGGEVFYFNRHGHQLYVYGNPESWRRLCGENAEGGGA